MSYRTEFAKEILEVAATSLVHGGKLVNSDYQEALTFDPIAEIAIDTSRFHGDDGSADIENFGKLLAGCGIGILALSGVGIVGAELVSSKTPDIAYTGGAIGLFFFTLGVGANLWGKHTNIDY